MSLVQNNYIKKAFSAHKSFWRYLPHVFWQVTHELFVSSHMKGHKKGRFVAFSSTLFSSAMDIVIKRSYSFQYGRQSWSDVSLHSQVKYWHVKKSASLVLFLDKNIRSRKICRQTLSQSVNRLESKVCFCVNPPYLCGIMHCRYFQLRVVKVPAMRNLKQIFCVNLH